jgi:hypothetical protein
VAVRAAARAMNPLHEMDAAPGAQWRQSPAAGIDSPAEFDY